MRIEQIRSFVTLYETASFTEAAARLYTSQPVVTRHLTKLERELGVPLFVRTTRHVAPTKAGDLLYEKTSAAMRLIDEGIAGCRALGSESERLNIGYEYLYMDDFTTPWLKEYREMHGGNVEMGVVEQPSPQMFDALSEGKLDCAFVGLCKEELIPAYLERRVVTVMGEVLFVGENHPLAARECVTVDDLIDEKFVYPLTRPTSRQSVVACDFEERGKPLHFTIALHQPSALKMVVDGGMVIDVPSEYHLEAPGLVRIPYKSDHELVYYFIWSRNNANKAFERFRTFFERKLEELNASR